MIHRQHLVIYMAAWTLAGCHRPAPALSAPLVAPTTYQAQGILMRRGGDGRTAVIAHQAIPGYMEAMTMEFNVRDANELRGLAPGDVINFRLSVTEDRSWVDQMNKTGVAAVPAWPTPEEGYGLRPGDLAPDCALIDSRGRPFRVSDYRGQVLVVSFIFTRCPLPDFCPRVSHDLAEVERILSRESGPVPWHLLSISFDPEYDTPERLAAYAGQMQANPAFWTVATGEAGEVIRFGSAFDLSVSKEGGQLTHNLRTVVLDRAGRVRRIFTGSSWTAQEMVAEMRQAMAAP